jgi:cytochrome b561
MPLPEKYSVGAMVLHWLMALLMLALFGLGWYMTEFPKGNPVRTRFLELHVSLGLTAALLVIARVVWRLKHPPPASPATIERWKRRLAEATHHLLYLLMFVQPVSGYISSSFSGLRTRFWGIPLPDWSWKSTALHELFTSIHGASSWALLALIVLHVLGVLHHETSAEKSMLWRMLPFGNHQHE